MEKQKYKISVLLDEVQEFGVDAKHYQQAPELVMLSIENEKVAKHLIANNVVWIPVRVGQTVYKICPICNPNHNGSCKHCAWSGCFGLAGCDIGVGVYPDGSCGDKLLQIVARKVREPHLTTILKWWNLMYFPTAEAAEKAMHEYQAIRDIPDRQERYHRYLAWKSAREYHFPFLMEEGEE